MDHKERVLEIVRMCLSEFNQHFTEVNLTPQIKPYRIDGEGSTQSIEMQIDFQKDGDLVDILEFHIVLSGKPTASIEETEAWLRESIKDVLNRARR